METRMIQIRDVPDEVHRAIKARAALAGMTLSDFLLREVERILETPPVDELVARHTSRTRPSLRESPAAAVRAERDAT